MLESQLNAKRNYTMAMRFQGSQVITYLAENKTKERCKIELTKIARLNGVDSVFVWRETSDGGLYCRITLKSHPLVKLILMVIPQEER